VTKQASIIIIDADPETRAEVHRTLALANLKVLAEGGHGVEGHTLVAESRPDCVLMGLTPPIERGMQTLEAIKASFPDLPVIVYSSVHDGASVRRAMVAGASDYLAAPLNVRTVGEAIYSVLDRTGAGVKAPQGSDSPTSHGAGMVITVFGAKGGIGKTTIATNLAASLAHESGASVALVDIDTRFGDVAIMMDAGGQSSIAEAARDADQLDRSTIRRYLTQHPSGVELLPAPADPANWDAVTPAQIERIVHLLAQTHDYVILDTPGVFNEVVATSLDLATVVLLVTSLEMASIKDTSLVLNMLRSWSFPEEKVRLTVNHANIANSVKESDIAQTLEYPLFWSIPYDEAVSKSTQLGQPVVLWQPRSRAAASLSSLASLVGGTSPRSASAVSASPLQRLLKRKAS